MKSYLEKLKQTFIDPSHAMSQELLTSLDKELFVSSNKEVLVDHILSGTQPFSKYLCRVGSDVYHDVEFFQSFHPDINPATVAQQVNLALTQGGQHLAAGILSHPVYDTYTLEKRKGIFQRMEPLVNDTLQQEFQRLASLEKHVFWAFDDIDQTLKDLYDMTLFRFCMFKPLNKYPTAITSFNIYRILISPLVGILSPIVYFVVPYLILSLRFKMRVPFKVYMKILFETLLTSDSLLLGGGGNYKTMRILSYAFSMVFYFQGMFNSLEISKTLHKVTKHLVEKINHVVTFLQTAHKINHMLWNHEMALYFIGTTNLETQEKEDMYMTQLTTMEYALNHNFGKQIHTYITLDKPILKSILTKVYTIDALVGFLQYKNSRNTEYATFVEHSTHPVVHVEGVVHPCIDRQKVVPNDLHMERQNIILTGPNAGGKSTFIKSILINVLLNQTITFSNATRTRLTPFYDISSQINIPDSKGYESLFEAEMYRCKHKLDLLKEGMAEDVPKKWALFVMDEIFNSTNPVEGIAGAFAIAKKMAEHPHCLLMFTTHYSYLTKLKHTGRFANYRMNIERTPEGDMQYPYKLQLGVSKQYIALELLRKNGFDEDLIQEALQVKSKLTRERV